MTKEATILIDEKELEILLDKQNRLGDQILALQKTLVITNNALALLLTEKYEYTKDKSLLLLRCGFRPSDVAELLGVNIGTVTKARSRAEGKTEH